MSRWLAHITVATIIEHNGAFLCVKESKNGLQLLNQPAGHVEQGETLQQAAVRETLEETGCQCRLEYLIGIYALHKNNSSYYRYCFAASLLGSSTPQPQDPAIDQALWLSAADLQQHKAHWRSGLVGLAIDDYIAGKKLPLDSVQETFE